MTLNCIIQWNLQSYRTKFTELKQILYNFNPICVCLQETLATDVICYPPSQYKIIHSSRVRNDNHERGAAILIHNKIQYENIILNTNLQAVAISIFLDRKFTVCSFYLPHHDIQENDIQGLINQLPTPFIFLGDANARNTLWGDAEINARGRALENIVLNSPISILNDGSPTHYHIQTNTYTTIDLSICSSVIIDDLLYKVLNSRYTSDHYPIKITWNNPPIVINGPVRFKLEKADWKNFKNLTEIVFPNNLTTPQLLETIQNVIITAADMAIPKTNGNLRKPPVPWWDENCRRAKREYNRAERALKRNPNIHNRIRYKRAKAYSRYTMNQAKTKCFQNYVSSINQKTTLHQVWKKVRKIQGKFTPTPNPVLLDIQGNQRSSPEDTSRILARQFASTSSINNYTDQFKRRKLTIEHRRINFNTNENLSYNDPISEREVLQALSQTTESSPGEDKITYSMIKNSHPTLITSIVHLFNKIFINNEFPNAWRSAIVVAIPKPGKDHRKPENFRPISLTSVLCKLLEKIVNFRLVWYLETNGYITQSQSGFRKNRSTTDNLVCFETFLRDAADKRLHTIAILFDIAKAYDTAWRCGILRTLHDIGLRGALALFLSNFLSDRTLKVRIGSQLSDPVIIEEGVPQGSVLSCTLFIIAMNKIANNLPPTVQSMLYVDDFIIYASGPTSRSIERQLQIALNNLKIWSIQTGFKFAPLKTYSIHICRKRNCPKTAASLTLENIPIRCVDTVKLLGLTIDNSLTWRKHIELTKRKCHNTLNLFKKLSNCKWGSDCVTLVRLYIMLLKPLMEYGLEAFSGAAETYINSLSTIQNAAIRIATGAYRTSPVPSLHALTSVLPHSYTSHLKQINYYLRLVVNSNHPLNPALINDEDLNQEEILAHTPTRSFLARGHSLHLLYQINTSSILTEIYPHQPPWRIDKLRICTHMYSIKKNQYPHTVIKDIFTDHLNNHGNQLHIYTDGSKTNEGVGYAYQTPNHSQKCRIPTEASIYTAELLAIRDAIEYATSIQQNYNSIVIFTDSRSAIEGLTNPFSKHPIIQTIQSSIILSNRVFTLCWVPSHVGITGNDEVDELARDSIRLQITPLGLPRSDIKNFVKLKVRNAWRSSWNSLDRNKLREILPEVPIKYNDDHPRHWGVKLNRLKIGHTRLTHEFLLKRDEMPYCDDCIVPLSIKHLLVECPTYTGERNALFGGHINTMTQIFNPQNLKIFGPLYRFLHQINIYDKI